MNHYKKYRNLFREAVSREIVKGFKPAPDWIVLEIVQPPDQPEGTLQTFSKSIPPLVSEVLIVGSSVDICKPKDLVLFTFQAGDQISSSVILVHKDDIVGVWGDGLKKKRQRRQKQEVEE